MKNKYFKLKWINVIISLVVLIMTLAFNDLVALAEKPSDDLKDQKDKTEQDRDENQQQLDATNNTIYALAAEQEDIDSQIEETTSALTQVLAEMEVIDGEIIETESAIEIATDDLNAAIESEQEQYESMKIRIKYLYETGETDLLSIYMESGSISEALTKADYVEDLYRYDREMLQNYKDTVATVQSLKETLETEEAELLELQAQYQEESDNMESVIEELKALSDDYASQIAVAQAQASSYAALIAEQNAQIKQLEEQVQVAEAAEAEEARRKAEEEARKQTEAVAAAQETEEGEVVATVTTTNNVTYDATPIYNNGGSDLGKAIAAYGCKFIGNPYVAGGTSLTNGADCSGFTMSVYKEFGYSLPRNSYDQRNVGREVPYSEAQPGDIICYAGHVGIYIGNGQIVHASTPQGGIKIGSATFRQIITVRRVVN